MELIELPRDKLAVGMALKFTLRDNAGVVLLAKENKIENVAQLEAIRARGRVYIDYDESDESFRAMMAGFDQLSWREGALKDFSKFVSGKAGGAEEEKLEGSLAQRWSGLESKLHGLLVSIEGNADFDKRVRQIRTFASNLLGEDPSRSQFLLFHRSITNCDSYSASHALLSGVVCELLGQALALAPEEHHALVCAAFTMNIGMTRLQDELSQQKGPPSPVQRRQIDEHATMGRTLLENAGVKDGLWLQVVHEHHQARPTAQKLNEQAPAQRLLRVLHTVDRYAALVSPRKSRSGRGAREAARAVVMQPDGKQDEAGSCLMRVLGLYTPGSYVKLVNGETGVVLRRGVKPGEPAVASVLNRLGDPIAVPRLHDTSIPGHQVQADLPSTAVRLNLNLEAMLKMMPNTVRA